MIKKIILWTLVDNCSRILYTNLKKELVQNYWESLESLKNQDLNIIKLQGEIQ